MKINKFIYQKGLGNMIIAVSLSHTVEVGWHYFSGGTESSWPNLNTTSRNPNISKRGVNENSTS